MSQINTGRLQLRFPLTDVDPRHIEWLNDKSLMRWSEQRWQEHDYDTQRQFLVDALIAGNPICFDIISLCVSAPAGEYGRSIGTIHAYLDKRHRRADLGIMLGPQYHGRGYGAEAWRAVEEHLHREHGIQKFEAGCIEANFAMTKLLDRLDYEKEGQRFCHFFVNDADDGKYYNLEEYGKFYTEGMWR